MHHQPATVRRVTIVDVARHAGVSTTAVSKVLRNAYGTSSQMRSRVNAAVDELGYRPSAAARALRGRTWTLGVMLPDVRNPFFADILDGVAEHLDGTEYQLFMTSGCDDVTSEARVTEAMIDRSMDGLILIAPVSRPAHLERVGRTVPTVVIGRHSRSTGFDTVNDDDFAGAGLMVAHLAGLGHRRIAHIEHRETDPVRLAEMPNALRADGYRHAMLSHGLGEHIDIVSTGYTRDGGYHGARILLDRPVPPTAIFAGADVVALGVLDALTEAGLSVPGDISVSGYDDITLAGFRPISLTTVDQGGHRIGTTAIRLLLDRITDPGRPAARVKLAPTPVVRATTGPPR
ncbi:LacI family DNA-binding transcriptional regulator [Actinoplanes sichuanensis]|uniref:LacI family DNA-binding transcriptional regulator n=1 Tax=Actinoplanes sichuanensis TaxID=512349 RepID=A0ABW4ANA1_9ACTN|nr:LacI family DNA-binding transcriptional regulator [Actinoplanes sichuanensis]BEL06670.1 LacI family DNA-binding transcriptional regulator [Actinoplanes sichuanensis]